MLSASTSHYPQQVSPSMYCHPSTSTSSPQFSTSFPSHGGSPSPKSELQQVPSTASSTATSFSDQSQSSNGSSSTSSGSDPAVVGYSNLFNSGMDNLANLRRVGTGKSSKFAFLPGRDRKSTFLGKSYRSREVRPTDTEASDDGNERRQDERALTSSTNDFNHVRSTSSNQYPREPFERKSTPTEPSFLATGSKAARILGVDLDARRNSYDSQSTRELSTLEPSIKTTKNSKIVREKSIARKLQKNPPGGKDGDRGSWRRLDM